MGLHLEARNENAHVLAGSEIGISVEIVNRSPASARLMGLEPPTSIVPFGLIADR